MLAPFCAHNKVMLGHDSVLLHEGIPGGLDLVFILFVLPVFVDRGIFSTYMGVEWAELRVEVISGKIATRPVLSCSSKRLSTGHTTLSRRPLIVGVVDLESFLRIFLAC